MSTFATVEREFSHTTPKEQAIKETMSPLRYAIEKGMYTLSTKLHPDSFLFRNYIIDINEHYLCGAQKGMPAIKLVQFSDMHLKTISPKLASVVARVNAMHPDLIFFTGDAIDGDGYFPVLKKFLTLFDLRVPKAAVLGNWEHFGRVTIGELRKLYAQFNTRLLVNETGRFSAGAKTISVTGLDDSSLGEADFEHAIKHYKPGDYHVVLSHCPEYRDVIALQMAGRVPVDFILSGHTHGGQLNFFGITPELPAGSGSYLSGWYNGIHPPMYVSKGLGTSIIPLRIGSTAEVGVFNLKG